MDEPQEGMGFYRSQVLPRCMALAMGNEGLGEHRERAFGALSGRVLELGFGSGLNLPYYPPEVTTVLAVEPALVNRKLARKRIDASPIPVEWVGLNGESLPVESGSVDAVTSSWTLCSINGLAAALAEVRRVLKPEGCLHFVEHGLAPDPSVRRWQARLNPLQRFCFGGCSLDLPIDLCLEKAGFEITELKTDYIPGLKIQSFLYEGVAR
ncbi:MAG: class I SAM-dependent methyltransferase [bacterium]